jgi:hypothetical protein
MSKRKTVIIDDDNDKKIRLQAKLIRETSSAISYSYALNYILRNNLNK